jgi:hypothetical protein
MERMYSTQGCRLFFGLRCLLSPIHDGVPTYSADFKLSMNMPPCLNHIRVYIFYLPYTYPFTYQLLTRLLVTHSPFHQRGTLLLITYLRGQQRVPFLWLPRRCMPSLLLPLQLPLLQHTQGRNGGPAVTYVRQDGFRATNSSSVLTVVMGTRNEEILTTISILDMVRYATYLR